MNQEISLAEKAIKELKNGRKNILDEERINIYFQSSESKMILLIVLRGEQPASIPIKLETKNSNEEKFVVIKSQIKQFVDSYNYNSPIYFTINDYLEKDKDAKEWFWGFKN